MRLTVIFAAMLAAAPLAAQTPDTAGARGMLFGKGLEVRVSSSLAEKDQAVLRKLIPLMEQQIGQPAKYYAAIAYAPDEGLVSQSLQGAFNFHTTAAADAAALAACDKARQASSGPCRLAARIVPRGYADRPLTLSSDATRAFEEAYRKKRGSRAFAISAATGAWGFGDSDAAAISACGASDCGIAIRD